MVVFECVGCGAALTVPVSRVELPDNAHQQWGNGVDSLGVLVESGTFAVDPEPSGPPWRRWEDVGEEEAAARGVFAPVFSIRGCCGSIGRCSSRRSRGCPLSVSRGCARSISG